MKRVFYTVFTVTLLLSVLSVHAQFPGGGGGRPGGGQNMNLGHFYGKVVDSASGKPIDAASVQLVQNKFDSVSKKRKDVVVSGMLTTKRGEFSLENLAIMASYKLIITAMGYKTIEQKAAFVLNMAGAKQGDMSGMMNAVDKDLGNIKMQTDALQLEGVTVTADKPLLTMAIDRKIFNVEKSLTSAGGTAVDVMKNVPSLSVDIDGNVSLRNSPPQIFVDGRPTTMTLEQIPADAISTVEIITNPSAKFDASGGGSGILNIVLKKNRKAGYNGGLRASIDSRGRPGFGGDINIKQQKINFFAATQMGFRKSISTAYTNRTDFINNAVAHLTQNNAPIGKGFFGFGRMGFDYFIDNRNTLSFAGSIMGGNFRNTDYLNINRDTSYTNGTNINDYGNRNTNSEAHFRNYGSMLSFKHNFAKANKELTADVNFNYSKNDNDNQIATQYFYPNNNPKTPLISQSSIGGGTTKFFTAQTDYANPITATMKIEAGARIAIRDFNSVNNNFIKDPTTGNQVSLTSLNNSYQFTDRVMAAYATFSQQVKKFSYQLGLRVESSKYDGTLINKAQKFSNEFPFSIFPSVFATYKLTDQQDLQVNYSRKINRPNFFQLIPFIDYTDSLNLSKGNPSLVPEFTNLIELSYQNQLAKGHSLLSTIYFKNTNDLISRYQYPEKNPNAPAKPDSVLFTSYANASQSYTAGLELTARNKLTKWWDLTSNLNLFSVTLKAGNLPGGVDNSQLSWFFKINNNFKLPKNYSIQLSGDYQAKTLVQPGGGGGRGMMFGGGNLPSAQGYIKPFYGVDIAIRKDFMKNNAASLTLQMSDVFRTRLNSNYSESIYFIQETDRRRDPQVLRLNFNWRFGKFDVSLLKRKNMKGEQSGMQEGMQGAGQ